jgi:hypothetical protein
MMTANATLLGQLMFLLAILGVFVVPVLLVASSRRAAPSDKPLWVLVTLLSSWLGVIAFLLANPKSQH